MAADKRIARLSRQVAHERAERRAAEARLAKVYSTLDAMEAGEHATKGRDYGRGVAAAARIVRACLDPWDRPKDRQSSRWAVFAIVGWLVTLIGAGAYAAGRVPNPELIDQIIRYTGTSMILGGLWLMFEAGRRYGRQP